MWKLDMKIWNLWPRLGVFCGCLCSNSQDIQKLSAMLSFKKALKSLGTSLLGRPLCTAHFQNLCPFPCQLIIQGHLLKLSVSFLESHLLLNWWYSVGRETLCWIVTYIQCQLFPYYRFRKKREKASKSRFRSELRRQYFVVVKLMGFGNQLYLSCWTQVHVLGAQWGWTNWDVGVWTEKILLQGTCKMNRQLGLKRRKFPDGFQGGVFIGKIWEKDCRLYNLTQIGW